MLNRIRIGPRLMLAFALMSALVAGMGFIAVWKMESINANTQYFAINVVPSFRNLHQIALELGDVREYENRYVLADTAAEMDALDAKIAESRRKIDGLFDEHVKEWISDLEDQGWLDRCRNSVNLHLQGWPALRELSRQKLQRTGKGAVQSTAALEALKGSSTKTYDAAQDMMDKWWDYNVRLTDETTSEAATTYANTRVLVLEILAGCVLLSIILAVLITRSIVRPIGAAVEVAQAAANGDLTARPQVNGSDEVAQLLHALKQMNDGLSTIVSEVRNAGDSIATGSAQIASGNTDLSQRTEEQAASLEETSASMLEIRSSMVRTADSAQQSVQLANSTSHTAQQGGVVMQQVINTMRDINTGAKKITDIISVIDGITFQINILALNAAVEAARAGEQGKGFAVVASEVRTLAQRSAESAREIRHLINASVEQIEGGSRQVEEAGAAMQGIVSEVNTVAHFITEIGVAMSEQTSAFNQITESVAQLDQVTQQNAALVEESAVAASSLRDQADLMIDVVSRFKLLAEYGNAIKGFAETAPYGDHARNMRATAATKKAASAPYVRPRKAVSRYANVATPPIESVSKSASSGEQNKATHDSEWQTF